ncbi:MAG: type II toxin-antitoxin system VapC family toxin [Chloroflexota bacterium]|nr:type II toxin-antitoxin system VapC family toxin [Chloroflexota bacterium]
MSDVVVDASIAVKWVVAEEGARDACALLQSWLAAGVQPVAPSWFTCEIANILHRKALTGDLSFADAVGAYDDLLLFVTILSENAADGKRSIAIARETNQQQSYDAQYLALAERLGTEYWTDDRRFVAAVSASFPQVKRLEST